VLEPFLTALVAFGISYTVLNLIEIWIHRLRHNPDKRYRWGVWTFAILLSMYAFAVTLGR
jgi:hypothetical protein